MGCVTGLTRLKSSLPESPVVVQEVSGTIATVGLCEVLPSLQSTTHRQPNMCLRMSRIKTCLQDSVQVDYTTCPVRNPEPIGIEVFSIGRPINDGV